MKLILALIGISVLVSCVNKDVKFPPEQCSYVSFNEHPCDPNSPAMKRVSDRRHVCDTDSPHFEEALRTCKFAQ
jgi:hypothetical protein